VLAVFLRGFDSGTCSPWLLASRRFRGLVSCREEIASGLRALA
jgi:hypothetical protein